MQKRRIEKNYSMKSCAGMRAWPDACSRDPSHRSMDKAVILLGEGPGEEHHVTCAFYSWTSIPEPFHRFSSINI